MSQVHLSNVLPNYSSFIDTKTQKAILIALTIICLLGCSLGLMGHFHIIAFPLQCLGWTMLSLGVYPIGAGISHLFYKCLKTRERIEILPDSLPNVANAESNNINLDCQRLLEKWNQKGVLSCTDSFIYVKVDDVYFKPLFLHLKQKIPSLQKPYQPGKDVGSHVTVVSFKHDSISDELLKQMKQYIESNKQVIGFNIIGYKVIYPTQHQIVRAFHVIQLEAPALEKFRENYKLTPKQGNGEEVFEFHVTIGEELK